MSPNLASHEKSDGISLPHENGVKINVARKDSQISAVPLVGIHVEEKEEARTKVFAESSVSSSIVSCQVEAAPGTTFAGKVGAPPDTAGELLSENVDQSLQTRNEPETRSDPQDAAIKEVSKECNEMNISPVLSESSVRESRVTEAVVVPESYKEPIIEKYALQDAANASGEFYFFVPLLPPGHLYDLTPIVDL